MTAQPGEFLPVLAAVGRPEEGGVLHAGIDGIGIGQRRFQMPHPRKLPGMLASRRTTGVCRGPLIRELIAHRLPGRAAVGGALDQLPEPAARLRGV